MGIPLLRRVGIFPRLALSFLSIILLFSLTLGTVVANLVLDEVSSRIFEGSLAELRNTDEVLAERLKKYEALSALAANSEEIKGLLRDRRGGLGEEPFRQRLAGALGRLWSPPFYPYLLNLLLVTPGDQVTASGGTFRLRDPGAFRNSEDFRRALEAGGFPVLCDTTRENSAFSNRDGASLGQYVTLLRVLADPGAAGFLGVVVLTVSVNLFSDPLSGARTLPGSNNVLVSDRGVVTYLNPSTIVPTFGPEVQKRLAALRSGQEAVTVNQVAYLCTGIQSQTGWTLVNLAYQEAGLRSVNQVRSLIFAVALFCALLALVLASLVTRSIAEPLGRLKAVMVRDDPSAVPWGPEEGGRDEVAVLGRKFGQMLRRTQELSAFLREKEVSEVREKLRRQEAEFNVLQMQINPHFLYNTLDIIRWQAIRQERGQPGIPVSTMISQFSALLRFGTSPASSRVTLGQEADHIRAYLQVVGLDQQTEIRLGVQASREAWWEAQVPRFTLQPLVENAVVHGFGARGPRSCTVQILVEEAEEDWLTVEVLDNGQGIEAPVLADLETRLAGAEGPDGPIGLGNVDRRLKMAFGPGSGLRIRSRRGEFTSVVFRLPRPPQEAPCSGS